jgi:hypothetical protein
MSKERSIVSNDLEKILKDTGTSGRPFYALVGKIRRLRIFGLLVYKGNFHSNLPDISEKE